MSASLVIAGTDTDIGKTVFAAGLARALNARYWKPIQAGLSGETDSQIVQRLAGAPEIDVLPEAYRLQTPASPHLAAERDGIEIDLARLQLPSDGVMTIIELAGGLAVPITRSVLQIDLVARWRAPVILCAGTHLGTINHSLLSIEALKRRAIPILGLAFMGDTNSDTENTICAFGGVRHLGRLPRLAPLTPDMLHGAFANAFDVADLLGLGVAGP